MRMFVQRLFVIASLVLVAGCEEEMIALGSGTPSVLTVRAFVDANGSGDFDGGDLTIASATVTADGEAGQFTATTEWTVWRRSRRLFRGVTISRLRPSVRERLTSPATSKPRDSHSTRSGSPS